MRTMNEGTKMIILGNANKSLMYKMKTVEIHDLCMM
jgi:hypothetical protein